VSSVPKGWHALLVTAWLLSAPALGPAGEPPQSTASAAATVQAVPAAQAVSFDGAVKAAQTLPRLHSLLVSRGGEIILERYFHGARANRPANIKSVSKAIVSALVGIAIERGLIESIHAPIGTYFPALLSSGADPHKQQITIQDLLTMRSGLESTSNRNYGAWVQSKDWVRYALTRRVLGPPGGQMIYSTGNTHLLSAILTKVSGGSTWDFARESLAEPLSISLPRWPQDPQGIYFGGNDMLLTPREMAAFGEMYLRGGRANGRQIVPASWVEESFIPRTRSRISRRLYGYGWWIRDLAGHRGYYAWGFGGQFIFLFPDLDMVVVTTSSDSPGAGRRDHLGEVYDLVEDHIVVPVAAAQRALTAD
jgi:CubicO group peptidase (beta-lactamase class C family)